METTKKNPVGRPIGSVKFRNPYNPKELVGVFEYRKLLNKFKQENYGKVYIELKIKVDKDVLAKYCEKKLAYLLERRVFKNIN